MKDRLAIIITERNDHYLIDVLRLPGSYCYAHALSNLPDIPSNKGILINGYLDYVTQSLFEIRYQYHPFIAVKHRTKGNLCLSSTDSKYEIKTALILDESI